MKFGVFGKKLGFFEKFFILFFKFAKGGKFAVDLVQNDNVSQKCLFSLKLSSLQ